MIREMVSPCSDVLRASVDDLLQGIRVGCGVRTASESFPGVLG